MAVSRKLTIVFALFYVAVIIYLFLFLTVPEVQDAIIKSREQIATLTQGANYFITILISIFICFIGNASIGFPIPYPFVLFSFSQSIFTKYALLGLPFEMIMINGYFWLELTGIIIAGGLGSILGELVSVIVGFGAKKVAQKTDSQAFQNVKGFGRIVLDHPKSTYLFIFLAAALPIPDDPIWIALGMSDKKVNYLKCVIWGWLGKNITTLFYVTLPILIILGYRSSGIEINDINSVITESIMLLVTLTVMFFILNFNWDKFIEQRQLKKHN
jgi:hypothetical protein